MPSAEELARLKKVVISDADFLRGGAEYVKNENGDEARLHLTEEQMNEVDFENKRDTDIKERKAEREIIDSVVSWGNNNPTQEYKDTIKREILYLARRAKKFVADIEDPDVSAIEDDFEKTKILFEDAQEMVENLKKMLGHKEEHLKRIELNDNRYHLGVSNDYKRESYTKREIITLLETWKKKLKKYKSIYEGMCDEKLKNAENVEGMGI